MFKNSISLKQASVFLFIVAAFSGTSHALVVAPIIAMSMVKLLVIILSTLAIPIGFLVNFFTKSRALKTFSITIVVLLILGLIFYGIYFLMNSDMLTSTNNTSPTQRSLTQPNSDLFNNIEPPLRQAPELGAPAPNSFYATPTYNEVLYQIYQVIAEFMLVLILPVFLTLAAIKTRGKNWTWVRVIFATICLAFVLSVIAVTALAVYSY